MKFSTRELVYLAVFGALWGVVEITLGAVLKSMNIPLGGAVLAAIGLTIAMVGRLYVPKRGATLFIGAIAVMLKLFSLGGVIIGPMIGILSEALLAEIVLSLLGRPSRSGFWLAGGIGVLWTFFQPFVTGPLLYGRSFFVVWLDMLDSGSRLLGLPPSAIIWIALTLAGLHLLLGWLAGILAWRTGQRIEYRVSMSYPKY